MHRKMPTLQKEMQASSTPDFRYFTCLLDRGHIICGCASIVIQKNYLSIYNKVVQAILQKGKVIYGEERIFTCTYEMDVQISYRLHT